MAVNQPEPIEVNTFKFIQLRKIKVTQGAENLSSFDVVNVVATSSRYGLIFVGLEDGFKVLKLENILDLDEDKKNFRIPAENYFAQKVTCSTPVLLSLSSDDLTLAVCVIQNLRLVANMYDIRAFADTDEKPLPFNTIQLSSDCVELKDFMWNPAVATMYAFCLSNGAVCVHELTDTALKIVAEIPSLGATSVCWSPKGKQLVVGKKDGSFSQYKPSLQEMKKIAPPILNENSLEVLNICWLSTTLFAVVYISATKNEDDSPCLVFVSTPKGAPVFYSNYGDVCFGGNGNQRLRYLMYHQSEWGMLLCNSTTSVETAVTGSDDKANWQQWILEDSGRAELPLVRDKEPYPMGVDVIYCAQRQIILSDTEIYPPMPLLFLLSSTGILCPFHMLNVKPGIPNILVQSEPICKDGQRKCQTPMPSIPPPTPAPCVPKPKNEVVHQPFQRIQPVVPPSMTSVLPSIGQINSDSKPNYQSTPKPVQTQLTPFSLPPTSGSPVTLFPNKIGEMRSTSVSTIVTKPTDSIPITPKPTKDEKKPDESEMNMKAVAEEIRNFNSELQMLKQKLQPNIDHQIGTSDEMAFLKKHILMLSEFNSELMGSVKVNYIIN